MNTLLGWRLRKPERDHAPRPAPAGTRSEEPRRPGRQCCGCLRAHQTFTISPQDPSLLLPCFLQSVCLKLFLLPCGQGYRAVSIPPHTFLREDKLNMTPKRTMAAPSLAPHTRSPRSPCVLSRCLSTVYLPSRIRRGTQQGREDPPEAPLSAVQRASKNSTML